MMENIIIVGTGKAAYLHYLKYQKLGYEKIYFLDNKITNTYIYMYTNNVEVILINDGSTDNSLEVINKSKKSIKIITTENKGLSNARNRGLEEANGKYYLLMVMIIFLIKVFQ